MSPRKSTSALAAAAAPGFVLERSEAVPALIGRHEDFLFVAGLGRHRVRRRRGDRRRRPCLFARRRHGRGLHDGARPRAGAAGQARAGRDRRRRAADEPRRARHHRGDEPAQSRDPLRRQRPLRRDRLAEEPHQPRRRPREDRDRRRHQAHPHGRARGRHRRRRAPPARRQRHVVRAAARQADRAGRSSSATSMPRSAATASAPRCSRNSERVPTCSSPSPKSSSCSPNSVHRFAQAHLEKDALERAHDPRFPFDVAKLMSAQGLMGITIPEADGGQGGTLMDAVIAIEQVARGLPAQRRRGAVRQFRPDPHLRGIRLRRSRRRAGCPTCWAAASS